VVTGAGFFADSYDLFVTDGVTSILKNLGPVTRVSLTFFNNSVPTTVNTYFTARCVSGLACLPTLFNNATQAWEPNPSSVFTPEMTPRYALQTPDMKNGVSNAALIGSVVGQLLFGLAGDVLGRKWCFLLTTCLIIVGCLGSASAASGAVGGVAGRPSPAGGGWADAGAAPRGLANDVYLQLALWRGILGFGVGGEYPLAGTISSEGAKKGVSRGRAVLYTFSMQGWGKLTAALVNYGYVTSLVHFGGTWTLDQAWRAALAIGAIPNLATLPLRWALEESEIYKKAAAQVTEGSGEEGAGAGAAGVAGAAVAGAPKQRGHGEGAVEAWGAKGSSSGGSPLARGLAKARATVVSLGRNWVTLAGTASTWFLIDVTFYGQSLLNTTVVSEAVASTAGLDAMERLRSSLLSTVWIMLIAIPGYWLAIWLIDSPGRRPLQLWGFAICAAIFAALGLAYDSPLRTGGGGGGFVFLYGLTYLFSNAGPNSVTFLLPAEAFPTITRSFAHGVSAASGKVGATVGAFGLLELFSSFCKSQNYNCLASSAPTEAQQAEIGAGVRAVMLCCAAVAALGWLATFFLVRETRDLDLEAVGGESGGGGGGGGEAPARDKVVSEPIAVFSGSNPVAHIRGADEATALLMAKSSGGRPPPPGTVPWPC
jgi:PHS family inorganic phosphate transporter-like MFS transporter